MMTLKSYSEMMKFETFDERIQYLYLGDKLGHETFGADRYINQIFYTSNEWRRCRNGIILRDDGCDLGVEGCDLRKGNILIHHINPITIEDIVMRSPKLFDPENLISLSLSSHNYIHYGTEMDHNPIVERFPHDTCPWKR